jgi:hypothetical protein
MAATYVWHVNLQLETLGWLMIGGVRSVEEILGTVDWSTPPEARRMRLRTSWGC